MLLKSYAENFFIAVDSLLKELPEINPNNINAAMNQVLYTYKCIQNEEPKEAAEVYNRLTTLLVEKRQHPDDLKEWLRRELITLINKRNQVLEHIVRN